MAFLLFGLVFCGLTLLAVSLPKHFRDVFGHAPSRGIETGLRVAGWGMMGLSLLYCAAWGDFGAAMVLWLGLVTIATITVALLLTYRTIWWDK